MQEILRGKSSMTAGAVVRRCIATASNMEAPLKNDRFARSTVAGAAIGAALRGLATRDCMGQCCCVAIEFACRTGARWTRGRHVFMTLRRLLDGKRPARSTVYDQRNVNELLTLIAADHGWTD
jgi:hypothetical protein